MGTLLHSESTVCYPFFGSISQMTSAVVDVKIPVDEFINAESTPTTKSAVVDQELNRHGMGRYQWYAPLSC